MTLCTEACLVNTGYQFQKAITLYCNAWGCEHCHNRRVRRLIAEIIQGHPERLLTLTCRAGTKETPDKQAQFMSQCFRKLWAKVRKRWPGVEHHYFCVFEAHKSGWPHLHIATRGCYMDWQWIKDRWEEISGSPGVDIRRIYDPKDCGSYMAKYIGKNPHRYQGVKRYWRTLKWNLEPENAPARDPRLDYRFIIVPLNRADLFAQWQVTKRHVWLEGKAVFSGPSPPKNIEAMRAWTDRHILNCCRDG